MKNYKKLLVLSALLLVACGGGGTSNPSSEPSTSTDTPVSSENVSVEAPSQSEEAPSQSEDAPSSSEEEPTKSEDEPASSEDVPVSSEDPVQSDDPVSSDAPASSEDAPSSSEDAPSSSEDAPSSSEDSPFVGTATPSALCANNIPAGTYSEDTTFGTFTLMPGGKDIVVDSNNKELDGFSYTQRIKMGGKMEFNKNKGMIKIEVDGSAEIRVVSQSSSGSEDREFALLNSSGTELGRGTALGASISAHTFRVNEAGIYYLGGIASVNFYSIQVNGGSLEGTPVASKHSVLEVVNYSNGYFTDDMLSFEVGDEYEAGAEMDLVIHSDVSYATLENSTRYKLQINDRCYGVSEVGTENNEFGGKDLIYKVVMPDADATIYMLNCDNTEDAENGFNVSFEANEYVKMVGYNADAKYSGNFGAIVTWQWGYKPTAIEYKLASSDTWEATDSYIGLSNNYASINFYAENFTEDVTFRVSGEFVGCYDITYVNAEFVSPQNLPSKALPGVDLYVRWEDKNPYYVTGATIEGAEAKDSSTSNLSFTMPENNVTITFNYAEKMAVKFSSNDTVTSVAAYDGYGSPDYRKEVTHVKPGERFFVFAEVEAGNVFTGASLNGGEPLAVTEGNYGKYVQFIVPEDATEVVITVYTESANAITYESNEELGTISGDAGASSGSTVTVRATPVDNYHYLADLVAKDSEGNVVLTKEDFTFDRNDENKATYVMPESDITLVATFAAHETTNIIVNLTDSTNVSYFKLSGYDSSVYTGIGETGTYIQGEEAGLSISTIGASSVPSKLVFMDAEGNVVFSKDYETNSWGGSFGDFTIPSGYDTLIVDIEWTYQEAVSYTINDNGLEGYELRFNEESWSGYYETELGELYSGDIFDVSVYGEAGEGYVYVAKVTDTEGNPLATTFNGYIVNSDFVITIEKVAVAPISIVNESKNINTNYVSFNSNGNYYDAGDSIPVGSSVTAYISGYAEFKVTVTCGEEVVFEGSSEMLYEGYYECSISFTTVPGDIVVTCEEVAAEEPSTGFAGSYSTSSGITMEVNEDGTGYIDNGTIQMTFTWEEVEGAFTMTNFNDPSYTFDLDGVNVTEDGSIEVNLIQDYEYPFTLTFAKA